MLDLKSQYVPERAEIVDCSQILFAMRGCVLGPQAARLGRASTVPNSQKTLKVGGILPAGLGGAIFWIVI